MLGFSPLSVLPISTLKPQAAVVVETPVFGWYVQFTQPKRVIKKTESRSAVGPLDQVSVAQVAPEIGWLQSFATAKTKTLITARNRENSFAFPYQAPVEVVVTPDISWLVQFTQPRQAKPRRQEQQPTFVTPVAENPFGWFAPFSLSKPKKAKPQQDNFVTPYDGVITAQPSFGWYAAFAAQKRTAKQKPSDGIANVFTPADVIAIAPDFGWYTAYSSTRKTTDLKKLANTSIANVFAQLQEAAAPNFGWYMAFPSKPRKPKIPYAWAYTPAIIEPSPLPPDCGHLHPSVSGHGGLSSHVRTSAGLKASTSLSGVLKPGIGPPTRTRSYASNSSRLKPTVRIC